MKIINGYIFTVALLSGITASTSHASLISYNLDLTNALPGDVNYLTVTIEDGLSSGEIDFTVLVNTDNFPHVGPNFGMDNFYFNYKDHLSVDSSNIINLDPDSWTIFTDKNAGAGYGFFDINLKGTGNTRTALLTFSIAGIDGDTIYDYAIGNNDIGDALFAAHIGGNGAMFASSPIPVPAAVWLFGSGLVALTGVATTRHHLPYPHQP